MLLFIHIPKTAGTSFRIAAQNYFGSSNSFFDYGEKNKETSQLIIDTTYKNNDKFQLYKALHNKPNSLLCGHFMLNKYAPLYDAKNIICFVRKPEQQLRSHYEHYVQHHKYKKTFIQFIQEDRFINFQSHLLKGLPSRAIGFIGLTEQYEKSIHLINQIYKLNIEAIHANPNQLKINAEYKFNNEELQLIKTLNHQDYTLYSHAEKTFNKKATALKNKNTLYIGELSKNMPAQLKYTQISGWLINLNSDLQCHGKITINNTVENKVSSTEYRPWANEKTSIRKGYIGFNIKLTSPLKKHDTINLYAEDGELLDTYIVE